jgi:hypothetical protein
MSEWFTIKRKKPYNHTYNPKLKSDTKVCGEKD